MRLSLDGVPDDIHLDKVKAALVKIPEVKNVHHIHVWAISTVENALTAHLVLADGTNSETVAKVKHELKHEMEHMNIQHVTLETELESDNCEQPKHWLVNSTRELSI